MTRLMTQQDALGVRPLAIGEAARFFTADRFPGLDCLTASFRTHAYAPHTHETYAVGIIAAGCETWQVRGERHYGGPGDVAVVNPLEVHDGEPYEAGYAYRMTYPSVDLMRAVATSVSGRGEPGIPWFRRASTHDPACAALFAQAHAALENGSDRLLGEELLLRAYGALIVRHATIGSAAVRPLDVRRERGPVARVRALLEERFDEDLELTHLAAVAGLSTHHLIRVFRAEIGLTPHAYLVDVRIRRAQDRLRAGERPAETASAVGFADQAHLTRAFKARLGVGPGAYRRAFGQIAHRA